MPTDNKINLEISSVEEALEELRRGKIIIVIDDPARENEGDLVMAAEFVSDEQMAFLLIQAELFAPCKKEFNGKTKNW